MSVFQTGQAVAAGPSSPVALSATALTSNGFIIKAPASNAATVYIGTASVTSTTGFPLDPGGEFVYINNTQNSESGRFDGRLSDLYVVGTANDLVGWFLS